MCINEIDQLVKPRRAYLIDVRQVIDDEPESAGKFGDPRGKSCRTVRGAVRPFSVSFGASRIGLRLAGCMHVMLHKFKRPVGLQ